MKINCSCFDIRFYRIENTCSIFCASFFGQGLTLRILLSAGFLWYCPFILFSLYHLCSLTNILPNYIYLFSSPKKKLYTILYHIIDLNLSCEATLTSYKKLHINSICMFCRLFFDASYFSSGSQLKPSLGRIKALFRIFLIYCNTVTYSIYIM